MLSHFHVFLPIDHAFSLRSVYSLYHTDYDVNWYSTWPVGCLYIPDNLFYNVDDPRPTLRINGYANSNPPQYDPSYPTESTSRELSAYYGRYTRLESHSHLLPKS